MNYSFWEKYFIESASDITIIGSGIVGLSTAISIRERRPDLSVRILERGYMPYGASTKNAGFTCFGSVSELLDDIHSMGVDACMEVVKMRWNGLQKLLKRVGADNLEYQNVGGTELFRPQDAMTRDQCLDGVAYCNELIKTSLDLDDCYRISPNEKFRAFDGKCIFNQYEGTINPMSMMQVLKNRCASLGVEMAYGVEIATIDQGIQSLHTTSGLTIPYKKLVVCTNGFTQKLLPELDVMPARNQVLITKPIEGLLLTSGYHVDKGYIYFRQYQGRILLGGGRNLDPNGETTSDFGHTKMIQEYLLEILETISPGASRHVDMWWSGILGIGPSKYPIVRQLDEQVIVGVRLGGMGVAIGTELGDVLAAEIIALS